MGAYMGRAPLACAGTARPCSCIKRANRRGTAGRGGGVTQEVTPRRGPAGADAGRPLTGRESRACYAWAIPRPRSPDMAFTRAQATALLNQQERRLYDDSRANALRGLAAPALA